MNNGGYTNNEYTILGKIAEQAMKLAKYSFFLLWALAELALVPIILMWAINTLLGLQIAYTFKSWIAVVFIMRISHVNGLLYVHRTATWKEMSHAN